MRHASSRCGALSVWVEALLVGAALLVVPLAITARQDDTRNKTLKLQDGTVVHVVFAQELSSEKNHPEDPVPCEIAENVKVGDAIVIAKGTPAVGKVSQAEKRGGWGKSGTLVFSIDYVKAIDGSNVRLRGGSAQGGKQFSAGAAVMGLSGGFKKGKAIVVNKGSAMDVYVDGNHDVTVKAPTS